MMNLRPFDLSDTRVLYGICLRTGNNGEDGSGNCTHPDLVGDFYAVPYSVFDPGLCLMLHDEAGICGYVLGTTDSGAYYEWFDRVWLPDLREKYKGVTAPPGAFDGWILENLEHESELPDFVEAYPAHLHIDLLPRAQGTGWGRKMIEAWADLAAGRGAAGFHLGVSGANGKAVGFYRHVGLHEITAEDWGFQLGMRLPRKAPGRNENHGAD